MAYQFADGFDNYGNGFTLSAGYPWDTTSNAFINTTDHRFAPPGSLPGGCMVTGVSGGYVRKNLTGNEATVICGFGVKMTALPSQACDIWHCGDAGTIQCTLTVNNSGQLQFWRGQDSTAIGSITPANTITAGAWYGIALQVTINNTTGADQVYINGSSTPVLNDTNLNNRASANNYANQVGVGCFFNFSQQATEFDDFYCFDTTGGTLNSLPGTDTRILTKMPNAAGFYTNWTPNGLGSNYQNAAVIPPSASDYNANNTATTKDSYTTESAGLQVAPYFVVTRASLERDDAATHTPSIFMRSGSTDSSGVVTPALTSSYLFYDAVFATDPSTGIAWTGSGADAAQVGIIEG